MSRRTESPAQIRAHLQELDNILLFVSRAVQDGAPGADRTLGEVVTARVRLLKALRAASQARGKQARA
ncbi:MAG: hypothetical protein CMK33_07130 [Porticoccaceae bacterium]|nr:hypothetical protein [Porticoccaceae bacterium]